MVLSHKGGTYQFLGAMFFHELNHPLDRGKFQVHNIVIVGGMG